MKTTSTDTPTPAIDSATTYRRVANRFFRAALIVNPIVLDVANILVVSIFETLNLEDSFSLELADSQFGRPIWIITASLVVAGLIFLQKSRSKSHI